MRITKSTSLLLISFLIMLSISLNPAALFSQESSVKDEFDNKKKEAIINKISDALNEYYINENSAGKMEAFIKQKYNNGDYAGIKDLGAFTRLLTKDLQSVSNDFHLTVSPYEGGTNEEFDQEMDRQRILELPTRRKGNFGFRKAMILDGNIGYLDFRGFYFAREAGPTAVAALNFLAYCDALIIDLRKNGGGQPSMMQLIASYFFKKPTLLTSFYYRNGDIKQFWTTDSIQGPSMADTPLYILVSHQTFSAAEGFSYSLKHLGRATIIGETTRGGAHPQRPYFFPEESITINIPYAKGVNPMTKTNFEGKGVEPDIKVPAEDALYVAHIEALKNLSKSEKDESIVNGYSMIIEENEAKRNPIILDEEALQAYTGKYERGLEVSLDEGSLKIFSGMFTSVLEPMGNDKFMINDANEQAHFQRDDAGKVVRLMIVLRDGRKIPFEKQK